MRYLAAVENSMIALMEADPGYSGLITKNPIHSHWRTYWGEDRYDLDYLSEFLNLKKHLPDRGVKPSSVGIGRNVDSFDFIRRYAYKEIRLWKVPPYQQYIYTSWQNYLYGQVRNFTANEHPTPIDDRECYSIAKSVAHWVWTKFDIAASDERFKRRQAARGRASGQVRRTLILHEQDKALRLRESGFSIRRIASILNVPKSTIARWVQVSHEP